MKLINGPHWKGGKTIDRGYTFIWNPVHPRANNKGYVREHFLIAEKILGKFLLSSRRIHHFPSKKYNQLVICENHAYHHLLHNRYLALRECGNVHYRKCCFCKKWDDPDNLYIYKNIHQANHRSCKREYDRIWEAK